MGKLSWWVPRKWQQVDENTLRAYAVVFSTGDGSRVLQHLVDSVYATVYYGSDPIALAVHNGRRSLVQEILENIDRASNPNKYQVKVEETDGSVV